MKTEFNDLSAAQIERLAILAEECGEVVQVIGKILRHGYDSFHPRDPNSTYNRELLETELGDVAAAVQLLVQERDIRASLVEAHKRNKIDRAHRYLHHNHFKEEST